MAIKVLLIDDHLVVLQGLRFFLNTLEDIEIVGEAANGKEGVALAKQLRPDVVLMDLSMPEMDGIEATKRIKAENTKTSVIVLTSFSDEDHVLPALRAGAEGYQLKDIEPDELVRTIRAAHRGEKLIHPQATQYLLSEVTNGGTKGKPGIDELTPREKDVLEQITSGKSNKEISIELYITEKTVKTHVSTILSKLGVHDRTQAAIYAMKNGWFEDE